MRHLTAAKSPIRPPRLAVRKALVVGGLAVLVLGIALLVPLPSLEQAHTWASALGPGFIVAFFVAHVVVTILPIPRTAFTVAAGVLFGPVVGIGVAVGASTISAVSALLIVRYFTHAFVTRHLHDQAVEVVNSHLAQRGWLAVGSLRLIAPIPFCIVNYACGLSAVRTVPFAVATVLGMLPGTVALVVLADSFTGHLNPVSLGISAALVAIGVLGLVVDYRAPVQVAADSPEPGVNHSDTSEVSSATGV